jgi:hypothetical protein
MSDARLANDATGAELYSRVLGIGGTSKGTADLLLYPLSQPGILERYNLPGGTTALTLAIMRSGILTATNPGSTTITVPTLATLGWTYNPARSLIWYYQRCGLGGLFINPVAGVTIDWQASTGNSFDPQFLKQNHPPGGLLLVGDNAWAAI